jgi:hypothetical protein
LGAQGNKPSCHTAGNLIGGLERSVHGAGDLRAVNQQFVAGHRYVPFAISQSGWVEDPESRR